MRERARGDVKKERAGERKYKELAKVGVVVVVVVFQSIAVNLICLPLLLCFSLQGLRERTNRNLLRSVCTRYTTG